MSGFNSTSPKAGSANSALDPWDDFTNGASTTTSVSSFGDFDDFAVVGTKHVAAAPTAKATDELAAAKTRINKLVGEQIALQRSHDSAIAALTVRHDEEMKNISDEFAAVQEKRKKLFIDLKDKYQEATAAAAAAQSQVEASRAALKKRDEAIAERDGAIAAQSAELSRLTSELQTAKGGHAALRLSEKKYEEAAALAASYQGQLEATRAALSEREDALRRSEAIAATQTADVARLKMELDSVRNVHAASSSDVSKHKQKYQEAAASMSALQAELDEARSALSDREATLKERDDTIADRDDMIAYNVKELGRLRSELDSAKRAHASSASQLNKMSKRIAELEKGAADPEDDEWAMPTPVSVRSSVAYEQPAPAPIEQPIKQAPLSIFEPPPPVKQPLPTYEQPAPVKQPQVAVVVQPVEVITPFPAAQQTQQQPAAMSFDDFEQPAISPFDDDTAAPIEHPDEGFDESSLAFDGPEASIEGAAVAPPPIETDKPKDSAEGLEEQSRLLSAKCSINVEVPPNVEGKPQSPSSGKFETGRVIVFKWSLPGDVRIKWFRSFTAGEWEPISGKAAGRPKYTLTVDDVGATMKATATPVSGTGPTVFCERGTVAASTSLLNALATAIAKFDVVFNVKIVEKGPDGTILAPTAESSRQIALNKEKIKLRTANNKTTAKAVYSNAVRTTIDGDSSNKFFLTIEPNGAKTHYQASSARERDYIVESIRLFNIAIVNPTQFSVKPGAPTPVVISLAQDVIVQFNTSASKKKMTAMSPKNKSATTPASAASGSGATPKAKPAATATPRSSVSTSSNATATTTPKTKSSTTTPNASQSSANASK